MLCIVLNFIYYGLHSVQKQLARVQRTLFCAILCKCNAYSFVIFSGIPENHCNSYPKYVIDFNRVGVINPQCV